MCQKLVETIEYLCRHRDDSPRRIRELDGCGNCGIIQKTEHLGNTTKGIHALTVLRAVLM
jgi:hypothetical protein